MGTRGELFSTRVTCEGRTYFFNVKQNRMGDIFLNIVESKPTEAESFERRSIVIFDSDMKDFLKSFQVALSFIERAAETGHPLRFNPSVPLPSRKEREAAEGETRRRYVVRRAGQDSPSPGYPYRGDSPADPDPDTDISRNDDD